MVNDVLLEPQVQLQDLSGKYGTAASIRPRHYEIWFSNGNVTLRTTTHG
jgi:hypothetical protein